MISLDNRRWGLDHFPEVSYCTISWLDPSEQRLGVAGKPSPNLSQGMGGWAGRTMARQLAVVERGA